jgi:hypothetical protein
LNVTFGSPRKRGFYRLAKCRQVLGSEGGYGDPIQPTSMAIENFDNADFVMERRAGEVSDFEDSRKGRSGRGQGWRGVLSG